jgi:hypothetical protein
MSITSRPSYGSLVHFSRMTVAQAVISSMDSPFMRSADRKAAIWAGLAAPRMISSMASFACRKAVVPLDSRFDGFSDHVSDLLFQENS